MGCKYVWKFNAESKNIYKEYYIVIESQNLKKLNELHYEKIDIWISLGVNKANNL